MNHQKKYRIFLPLFLFFFFGTVGAQDGAFDGDVRVFLDCNTDCDWDFIRQELDFVDYVRDIKLANVYVLITAQSTGSGGREVKLLFSGRGPFTAIEDTLTFYRGFDDTDEIFRQKMLRYVKAGLVPYLARTSWMEGLKIEFGNAQEVKVKTPNAQPEDDPWNFWVFRLGLRGSIDGDNIYKNHSINGNFFSSRVTADWKHELGFRVNYRNSIVELTEDDDEGEAGQRIENPNHSLNFFSSTIKSLGPHWSAGLFMRASQSTFNNQEYVFSFKPAIEFDVFPYKESNQRFWTFSYRIGPEYYDYYEETIYDQTEELRFEQSLTCFLALVQKWGDGSLSIEWQNYLHDFGLNSLGFDGNLSVRLFKGFSFNMNGGIEFTHNQLNIQKGEYSETDVLLRRRQLATSFDYFLSFGFNYTFGSVFNNVVNPRFED